MADDLTTRGQLSIRLPNVPLGQKLDLIAAALAAVQAAHRDDMSPVQWVCIGHARDQLAAATLCRRFGERRLP
jgi:hypothetical protein